MNGPDILSAAYDDDPYSHYETMRNDFPVYRHEPTGMYVISRHADVARALKDPPFTNECYAWQAEPVMGGRTITQMDGLEHASYRRLLGAPLRGPDFRRRVVPGIEQASAELIEKFQDRGDVELMSEFATWLPINIMSTLIGLPEADRPRFQRWYLALIAHMSNLANDPDVAAAGVAVRAEMTAYLRPLLQDRRARPGGDILSALCRAEFEGARLTDAQIQVHLATLMTAGGDTTVSAISNTIKNLLLHPEHLRATMADRSLIDRMHAESLRLNPPVHLILRYAAEEVRLDGGVIPAGSTVGCVLGAANRDPARFSDPDVFAPYRDELDPGREFTPAGSLVAFGQGRHFCLGAGMARTTVNIAVNQLLDALPDLRLADTAELRETGMFTRRLKKLELCFTPKAHPTVTV
ncbi:cytochrome P450 [Herbidospora sp. NEAU-GS84]|uniref:Cytochrome P450 n=1 Tax=Herbidospora solisilvae TaxID=2696284 RepID=A0A7C9NRZ1_9ACTN|nr:cytochrome P450 [Herbidospora solisilvae]NAS25956.1 cytochrome P450 [Herbidospora solisilvae]